jgi:heparan-alpha-glucosaminide N-acetyltransferase
MNTTNDSCVSEETVLLAAVEQGPPLAETADRIVSVDTLRGLIILLMIFVNDVAGVKGAPSWLKHVSAQADAMTLPDVVFPAFLFIAGMSIPLALGRALARGDSKLGLLFKVLTRTLTLLIMGVLMVNMEQHNPGYRGLWGVLVYLGLFMALFSLPRGPGRKRKVYRIVRVLGAVMLLALALVYRTADGQHLILGPLFDQSDTVWLRHSWWGILGLIGWSYLVAALVYLLVGQRRECLIAATGLLAMVYVAQQEGLFVRIDARSWLSWAAPVTDWLERLANCVGAHVSIGQSLGSLASITMAGCCLGTLVSPGSRIQAHGERLRWALSFAAGLFLAALLFDPLFGINKIRATPAWCFLCASLTTLTWAALYWVMDVRGYCRWSRVLRPAGANPLTAYLLHPWVLMIAGLAHFPIMFYKNSELPVCVSILGCLVMALGIVGLTGLIGRSALRMKV